MPDEQSTSKNPLDLGHLDKLLDERDYGTATPPHCRDREEKGCVRPGASVHLAGLAKRTDLNGQGGVVAEYKLKKERWAVEVGGESVLVRPKNLIVDATQPEGMSSATEWLAENVPPGLRFMPLLPPQEDQEKMITLGMCTLPDKHDQSVATREAAQLMEVYAQSKAAGKAWTPPKDAGVADEPAEKGPHVNIRFVTKLAHIRITDEAIRLPTSLTPSGLSELVNQLLSPNLGTNPPRPFNFLLAGEPMRGTLLDGLEKHGLTGRIASEEAVLIEYAERPAPPQPPPAASPAATAGPGGEGDEWELVSKADAKADVGRVAAGRADDARKVLPSTSDPRPP